MTKNTNLKQMRKAGNILNIWSFEFRIYLEFQY
jgi:hypothetical protein